MKPTLDASTEPRQYDRNDPDGDARMRYILGLPPRHTAHVAQPRAFTADTPSKATYSRPFSTRSHKHYSRSEDK